MRQAAWGSGLVGVWTSGAEQASKAVLALVLHTCSFSDQSLATGAPVDYAAWVLQDCVRRFPWQQACRQWMYKPPLGLGFDSGNTAKQPGIAAAAATRLWLLHTGVTDTRLFSRVSHCLTR